MEALRVILWFLWLIISIYLVFEFVGFRGLVNMFPEGKRWWHFPAQSLSLFNFSMVIVYKPF